MTTTVIDVQPRVFKNYSIVIESDDYAAAIPSFTITPTQSVSTWKGGTPAAVFSDITNATWAASAKFAQDWVNADSFSLYLLNHEGEEKECVFKPLGTGPSFTVTLILAAPTIGGDIDSWGESTVNFGVQGKPVYAAGV